MIVREFVKCLTCGAAHTLRIGVGHANYQKHSFKCCKCDEDIVVGMLLDQNKVEINGLECLENCQHSREEGHVVNIHPDYVFPAEHIHSDMYFGAMEQMFSMKVTEANLAEKKGATGNYEEWTTLKKAWSLHLNGKDDLLALKLRDRFDGTITDINEYIFQFLAFFITDIGMTRFKAIMETVAKAKRLYPSEFNRFLEYYFESLKKEHTLKSYEILCEFFKEYTEYNQLYLYYLNDIKVPEGYKTTSTNYSGTKMFYGNCYEVFTSQIIVLAAINNIINGRSYDEFASMTLTKYKSIDKSNRCNPFKENQTFFEICKELDSSLRNATHHASTKLNAKTGIITYRSGGTGSVKTISYANYLHKCINLMVSLSILYMTELILIHNKR